MEYFYMIIKQNKLLAYKSHSPFIRRMGNSKLLSFIIINLRGF